MVNPTTYAPSQLSLDRRYFSRAMRACSTSVMSALFASCRVRASVVMIGVSGPICSASRTSSGAYGCCPSKPFRAMTNGRPLFSK